ncbi:MAG: hypothetical protein ABGY95_09415 [Rubritalea sp.]|uniref:hypothetical protein n=1 Tax=Rubritalea sp. TaxID=2109375 RepID=UPI003242C2A6
MEKENNTFEFYDTDPLVRAQDLLQEWKPNLSKLKQRAIARKAIDISHNCLSAWLVLTRTYSRFPQSKEKALNAIRIGKAILPCPFVLSTETGEGNEKAISKRELDVQEHSFLSIIQHMAKLYFKTQDYASAIDVLELGLSYADDDPLQLRDTLCATLLFDEQFEEAQKLVHNTHFEKSLASSVAQAYLHFKAQLPHWTPDQMDEIGEQLCGHTLWQWAHKQSNGMKRHFRAINHANPFFAAFMLNPECRKIKLPLALTARHASEALSVAQVHQELWADEELPLKLLEEFPWENPTKKEILKEDKPLLLATIKQLEKHRELLRQQAEKEHLDDHHYY